jgi:hypothetical protein
MSFDASLGAQTTIEGIRSHKLPPALANLTDDDPVGDNVIPALPEGVAMVQAFPSQEELKNAIPEHIRQRSRAILEELLERERE